MAHVTCPECQHRFPLPKTARAGDDLVCPDCDETFEVGEIPTRRRKRREQDDDDDDRPRRPVRRKRRGRSASRGGMKNVSLGYKLVYYGVLLAVLAVLVAVGAMVLGGGAVLAGGRGAVAGLGFAGVLLIGTQVLYLVAAVLGLVGVCLCLAVPVEAGNARTLIMVCIGLLVGSILLGGAGVAGVEIGRDRGQLPFFLAYLLVLGSSVVFLLFSRALAEYLDRNDLADLAMSILVLMAIQFVLGLVITAVLVGGFLAGLGGAGGGAIAGGACIAGAVWLVSFVLGIMALIKFTQLVRDMSEACGRYADRGSARDEPTW